jgi:rRNA maturation protein Nop10
VLPIRHKGAHSYAAEAKAEIEALPVAYCELHERRVVEMRFTCTGCGGKLTNANEAVIKAVANKQQLPTICPECGARFKMARPLLVTPQGSGAWAKV